ncbi:MAG: glycosyltransferase [Gaiellaceae bacterium]
MGEPLTILIAARDEEARIGATIEELRRQFPDAELIVADDGSRDATAAVAEDARALVVRLPRRGKGQTVTLGERVAAQGDLLLCDADLRGDLRPLLDGDSDLTIARFARRQGGGFGIAKEAARRLIRLASGYEAHEPLSGQRRLTQQARAQVFPLAAGFGCEAAMTADARRAGLTVAEAEVELEHRVTGRDLRGFLHRSRQLRDIVLAFGPQGRNHRGLRLPLVGWTVAVTQPSLLPVAALGVADDLWSGEERGFRDHLGSGATTGVLKLVGIPAYAFWRTRSVSGALLVGLAANMLNQLDTKPGRALKVYLALSIPLRAPKAMAVLLTPYDLREMAMLGDSGSNTLGAVLGLRSVGRLTERQCWSAIAALAGLTLLGERRSLGHYIERTPVFREVDGWGRQAQ